MRPGRAADHLLTSSAAVMEDRAIPLPTLWATPGKLYFLYCSTVARLQGKRIFLHGHASGK